MVGEPHVIWKGVRYQYSIWKSITERNDIQYKKNYTIMCSCKVSSWRNPVWLLCILNQYPQTEIIRNVATPAVTAITTKAVTDIIIDDIYNTMFILYFMVCCRTQLVVYIYAIYAVKYTNTNLANCPYVHSTTPIRDCVHQ